MKNKEENVWITVLRGLNRIIRLNIKWDFKRENWKRCQTRL